MSVIGRFFDLQDACVRKFWMKIAHTQFKKFTMKTLSIQIQPELDARISQAKALSGLKAIGITPEVQEGNDNGHYINFFIFSEDMASSWLTIKSVLFNSPGFIESSIITCEGNKGWDDYLLLHHYDEVEKLDFLE